MGAFLRKWRPNSVVKPECLYVGFDEELFSYRQKTISQKGSKIILEINFIRHKI